MEVHHCVPFAINRQLELVPSNLLTLCEAIGRQCHLKKGHNKNWRNFNPNVKAECTVPDPDAIFPSIQCSIVRTSSSCIIMGMAITSRPLTQPHPDRLAPDHPLYEQIILCHSAAVEAQAVKAIEGVEVDGC